MAPNFRSLDWNLVQSFVFVAQEGSLSGAAQALGHSQPTVGRHIKSLEAILGVSLFNRKPRGLELSSSGLIVLDAALDMHKASMQLKLSAEGQDQSLVGTVRVTASEAVSHYLMPRIVSDILLAEPKIQIELVPSNRSENLLFREADIAVRMYRPTQLDVVTKHVTDLPIGFYGARSYLERRGTPTSLEEAHEHDFVGFDHSDEIIVAMRSRGLRVDREFFVVRTDSHTIFWELLRAGCGLGTGLIAIGDSDPAVQRLFDVGVPPLPVWLTAPEVLRTNPRIRRVYDLLATAFASLGSLEPEVVD